VKWIGYASAENTWELPSNIPSVQLNTFESSQLVGASTATTSERSGLRDRTTRRLKNKPDYIVNQ